MRIKLFDFIKNRPLFTILLCIFFVLHGFTENYDLVPVKDALVLTGIYILTTLTITGLLWLIFRNLLKASLGAFTLLAFHFFFGAIHDEFKKLFDGAFVTKYSFILPASFILILFLLILIQKWNKPLLNVTLYLNALLILLIIFDSGRFVFKSFNTIKTNESITGFIECRDCKKPNIYLILSDEYAGSEALKDIFSFDNSAFEEDLRKRNFHVVPSPSSNYNYTPYSIASLFNMNYLNGITDKSNDINNRNISFKNINKNNLTNFLYKSGYDFVNLSLFDFADKPTNINNNKFYSTRGALISSQTLTGRIKKDLWYHLITTFDFKWAQKRMLNQSINTIQQQFENTISAAENKSKTPLFIYTHFMMPHYPYLFDKTGNQLSFEESMQGSRKDLYLQYLQYSNNQFLSLIDSIQEKDKTNPVIILMSDHGFNKYESSFGSSYNFKNIINIYLPDKHYSNIPDSLSNVNLFRLVFNHQFRLQLPLLKDSTIFLKEY